MTTSRTPSDWMSLRGAARALATLGVPALLATMLAAPAWAQDDDKEKDTPPMERIRPAAGGPVQPGGLPPGPNGQPPPVPGGPANEPPVKGAEAQPTPDAGGSTGSVTTKKVPCVEPSSKVTIDFVDAPLMDVAKYMAEITCRNFILGEELKGQVTIISHQQVSVAEAYEAFLSSLEVAGFTTVTVGGNTKIVATSKAGNAPLRVYEGDNIPGTDNFVTQIIELDNVTVSDISTVVRELSGPSAKVIAYAPTNTLILTDAAYNIRRVYRIVKQMDVAAPKSRIEVIPIRFATAAEVERILEEVYGVAATSTTAASTPASGSAASRRRGRGRDAEPEATSSTTNVGTEGAYISKIIADERTNSLILLANDEAIAKVKELVAQVDVDIDPASRSQIHVIYLDHANAEEVASVISSLSQGTGSGGGTSRTTGSRSTGTNRTQRGGTQNRSGGGGFGGGGGPQGGGFGGGGGAGPKNLLEPGGAVGDGTASGVAAAFDSGTVRITADENTNSLVLLASPEDFRVIKSVIDRLDIPRRQVYVEAVVLEVGSEGDLNLGIGYHAATQGADGSTTYASSQLPGPGTSLGLTADALSGLAMGLLGTPVSVLVGGVETQIPAFGIAINALASNSAVNILSNPNILVLDNEEATISVGRNVPFPVSSGFDVNGQQIRSFQREDVGIVLQVTPQINENNYVTLEMSLEVAEVEEGSGSDDGGFITSKRETENVVVVRDNQTIVIGGLIGTTQTEAETKIPILGDIPLLGVLFRGKRNVERKTNLLIFLTPHVINEQADLEEVYRVKVAQREEFLRRFYGKSREEQEAELQALLRGSMNLIDEPSMYRKKPPPKPMDSKIQDDSTLVPIDGAPTEAPAEPAPPPAEPTPDFDEGGEE